MKRYEQYQVVDKDAGKVCTSCINVFSIKNFKDFASYSRSTYHLWDRWTELSHYLSNQIAFGNKFLGVFESLAEDKLIREVRFKVFESRSLSFPNSLILLAEYKNDPPLDIVCETCYIGDSYIPYKIIPVHFEDFRVYQLI